MPVPWFFQVELVWTLGCIHLGWLLRMRWVDRTSRYIGLLKIRIPLVVGRLVVLRRNSGGCLLVLLLGVVEVLLVFFLLLCCRRTGQNIGRIRKPERDFF